MPEQYETVAKMHRPTVPYNALVTMTKEGAPFTLRDLEDFVRRCKEAGAVAFDAIDGLSAEVSCAPARAAVDQKPVEDAEMSIAEIIGAAALLHTAETGGADLICACGWRTKLPRRASRGGYIRHERHVGEQVQLALAGRIVVPLAELSAAEVQDERQHLINGHWVPCAGGICITHITRDNLPTRVRTAYRTSWRDVVNDGTA